MTSKPIRLLVGCWLAVLAWSAPRPAQATPTNGPAALRRFGCTSCHLDGHPTPYLFDSFATFRRTPSTGPTECARCHVNDWLAASAAHPAGWLPLPDAMLARIRRFHAFVDTPALALDVDGVPRFSDCGLARFLEAPVPRRHTAAQSMFPLEPARRDELLRALAPGLARCAPPASLAQIALGRRLFDARGCANCHAQAVSAPRLRIGIPLLGRDYFALRVRHGAQAPIWQRRWQVDDGRIVARAGDAVSMPPEPDLSPTEIDALYAYVGSDTSDVPPPRATPTIPRKSELAEAIRIPLFREVQHRVFDTSCRHCHATTTRDQRQAQQSIRTLFASTVEPLALPLSARGTPTPNPQLKSALSPGPGCSDSRLLVRLKSRRAEWSGQRDRDRPRGMPLTLPPLSDDTIRLVEVWTRAGCPSDGGDLCARCAPESLVSTQAPLMMSPPSSIEVTP
jgi:hypothetical protein